MEKYKEKYPELKLDYKMKGSLFDIVNTIFRVLMGKKVTVPHTFKRFFLILIY